ncbi:MAG: flagellar motor switch protein FliG, partial [Firmicutes bacterium]|nr:flagellar motor switch protein FliG [Bacillota bacterium]
MAQVQQYKSKRGTLTGKQKAAILMVTLGPELSANIYKHLREEEIEDLTLEIANIKRVEPQVRDEVLVEFKEIAKAQEYISTGGIE